MTHLSRRTFLEMASATLICGCGGSSSTGSEFLAFSDVHFDPFYDPQLFHRLDAADPFQWKAIFESSAITTPSIPGCDTNYPLFTLALESIRRNLVSSQVVVYCGDLLGHNIATQYEASSGSNDASAMQGFVNKAATFVMLQIRAAAGSIPVVFAVGNCDSYTGYGPDSQFLDSTAEAYYSLMLEGAGEHQEFLDTFKTAGYYAVELFDKRLMVISLNTVLCSSMISSSDAASVDLQLLWLEAKLAAAKAAGQKVWLLMHVPVGAYVGPTAQTVNADGQLSIGVMMWTTNYQDTFLTTLKKYPGLLSMCIAGHTHMDEYRIMSPEYVLEITPGISPVFGNDPAYKIFTTDGSRFAPTNYRSINLQLETFAKQFEIDYTFTTAYSAPSYSNAALNALYCDLPTDKVKQALFRKQYYCGNDSSNSISNLTWPVYWSTVGNVSEDSFLQAVNAYR